MEISNSKQLQGKIGVDSRVGTILWVRRKNGSWWPGRIVGPTELSPSHLLCPRPTGTPVKLLGREYSTVNWYNLNTSRCIKAFRCGEFDNCIEKAEAHWASPSRRDVKYARRNDAIRHALELEKQELLKKYKRPGEELVGTIFRAKRTKRVYLPAGSKNCLEPTFHEPLRVPSSPFGTDKCSFQCDAAEENPPSKSTESDSSERDSQDPEKDEGVTTQLSDFRLQKCMLKGKVNGNLPTRHGDMINGRRLLGSKNGKHTRGHSTIPNRVSEDYSGTELNTRSGENLVSEANMLSQLTPRRDHLEKPGTQCFDRVHVDPHNMMESTLIDVELTVQASYQGEHVPLISLMSGLSGKAIVGHPIEIELEASERNSLQTLLQSTILQPVWRTSRRTPVCYVSHPNVSSAVKDEKNFQTCHNHDHLNVKGKENNSPETEELLRKPPKKRCLSKPKARTLTSFATEQKFSGNQLKQTETMPTRLTCIPVKLIFSKLLVEVGGQQS